MIKRIGKYNFYKMEIRADIIYAATRALNEKNNYGIKEFYDKFDICLGFKANQNNYQTGAKNFLAYYGIVEMDSREIKILNKKLINFAAQSIENSGALIIYLVNFEFDNSPKEIKKSINDIVNKIESEQSISKKEIVDSFKIWFDNRENKKLLKWNTKDTAQKFLSLVTASAFVRGIHFFPPVTSLFTIVKNSDFDGIFQFSLDDESIYNFFIKTSKVNAKNVGGDRIISPIPFDVSKIRTMIKDIEELLQDDDYDDYDVVYLTDTLVAKVTKRSPIVKADAFKVNGRVCFVNHDHLTFKKSNGDIYMESHHGLQFQNKQKFGLDDQETDVIGNIFSLCANCHKMVHFGSVESKKDTIEKMYEKIIEEKIIESSPENKELFFSQYNIVNIKQ